MAIEDNRIFNSNAEEIFLLQSMDGGGGSGGGFNGKYIAINSALNQVNGFNSLSIGKDNISATARTFTFGKNNLNLFENTLILGDKNKAVETMIYYNQQDNPYGDIGGKIINGKNNTLYNVNGASGIIINGENIEGGISSLSVDVYVSAAGTEYHDDTYYYERVGMGQYERAYPTSSTYQDYYIKQENIIPLDDEHIYYGYFDTEGNYIFYKDTTFTEAWDLTEVDDTVILFDINTDTKVESIPYANIYYYYQGEYYNMPYASYLGSNVSNTIMNGSNIKNNVSPSGSIISGSNIRNNGNTHESLISGYNIENNNIYHSIIGGSNIQNNPSIGTSLVCGENIENLASIQDSIITGKDIKGYSGYGENNGSVYYSALSGYDMKIYGASINYSSIGGYQHSIKGETNYSLIHGSYLTLTGNNNYSIIGGYNHELKTTSYSLVSGYNNIINSQCYYSIIGGNYNHLFNPNYSLISGYNHTIDGSYNIIGGSGTKNKGSYNVIGGYGNQPNFGNYNIIAGYNNKSTSTINLNDYYKYDNETHKYIKIYNGSIATSLNNDDYVEYFNESEYSTKVYKVIDSDYTTPYDSTYFNAYLAVDWEYSNTYQPGDYVSRYYVYKCIAEATHIDPEEDTQHQYYLQITNEDTPYWEPIGTYEQGEYLQENPGWHDQYFYQAITNVSSGFELVNSVNNLSTNYNAIFGNNNTYQNSYNIIAGEENTITGDCNAAFGHKNSMNAYNSLTFGEQNIVQASGSFVGGYCGKSESITGFCFSGLGTTPDEFTTVDLIYYLPEADEITDERIIFNTAKSITKVTFKLDYTTRTIEAFKRISAAAISASGIGGGGFGWYDLNNPEGPQTGGTSFGIDLSQQDLLISLENPELTLNLSSPISIPANIFIKRSELNKQQTGRGYGPNIQSSDKSQVLATGGIAVGTGVVANSMCQTVIGRGNILDSDKLFIIGNGRITPAYDENHDPYSDTLDRSNALTVDWAGNQVLAGKLTVGAAPTASMDVTTKQYVDTADAAIAVDVTNLKTRMTTAEGNITSAAGHITTIENDLNTANTGIKAKLATAESNISNLSTTVGDSTSGLVKDVDDIDNRVITLEQAPLPTVSLSQTNTTITGLSQGDTDITLPSEYTDNSIVDIYVDRLHYCNTLDFAINQGIASFFTSPIVTGNELVQVSITNVSIS